MPNIDTCAANPACRGPGRAICWDGCGRGSGRPVGPQQWQFYTANDLQPRAAAAVVVDGRITFVAATPDALRRAPPGARKNSAWLSASGWIESRCSPPVFPTRQDLDAAVADRPVVLTRGQAQALVANSMALQRAGIDRNTDTGPAVVPAVCSRPDTTASV